MMLNGDYKPSYHWGAPPRAGLSNIDLPIYKYTMLAYPRQSSPRLNVIAVIELGNGGEHNQIQSVKLARL